VCVVLLTLLKDLAEFEKPKPPGRAKGMKTMINIYEAI
jgi:hypothetical protein